MLETIWEVTHEVMRRHGLFPQENDNRAEPGYGRWTELSVGGQSLSLSPYRIRAEAERN